MKVPSLSRRRLLAGAGVGALSATAVGASGVTLGPDSIRTRTDDADWPLRHRDTHNTGVTAHADGPDADPTVRWRADRFDPERPFRGYLLLPTPVVVDGRVYVGGGRLSALRTDDGREAWSVPGGDGETFHGAAHAGSDLVVSTYDEDATAAGVAAFDLSSRERRWYRRLSPRQIQTPLVAGRTVYVPTLSETVALSSESGASLWRVSDLDRAAPPAVTDDALYLPESYRGLAARDRRRDALAALLGDSPSVRWRYRPEERADPAPAVGDGRIFAPETEEWYPYGDESEGVLACLDPDGTRRWSKPGGTFATSPVVTERRVLYKTGTNVETIDMGEYVDSRSDARVTAHDPADGRVQWTRTFADFGSWRIAPVSDGDRLYVPLHDGIDDRSVLVALDAATGETRWRRELGAPAYHLALAGDALYVSTDDGTLLALE